MSTGANHTDEKKTSVVFRIICCVCALAAVLFVMSTMSVISRAADDQNTASVATAQDTKEDTDEKKTTDVKKTGIVLDKDGYFRCYLNNKAVSSGGWTNFENLSVYIDKYGHVTNSYDNKSEIFKVYKDGKISAAKNCLKILSDGYPYYFDSKGKKIKKSGWYKQSSKNMYYISDKNRVTKKFVRSGDKIKIYKYVRSSQKWSKCANKWETINNTKYRLASSGKCTTIYYKDSKKAYTLTNKGKFQLAKKMGVKLEDGLTYYFNNRGVRVSKKGWYVTSAGANVYTGRSGNITVKILKTGGVYKMYKYSAAKKSWAVQKNLWKKTGTKLYYFSKNGKATVVYNLSTRKLYSYSSKSKKYVSVRKTIKRLNGSRYYYYNSKGVRTTLKGWKQGSGSTKYYVGSKGYVTSKYTSRNGIKKLYTYNYKKKKWVIKKNQWKTISDCKIYFGSKGVATVKYDMSSKKAYTYSNKKWRSVKKAIKKIAGVNYYFNSKGVRVTKSGVYKTSNGYLAYVNKNGAVYKREYDLSFKRNYTIDLGNGKKTKVYGYYDLDAASSLIELVNSHRTENGIATLKSSDSMKDTAATRAVEISNTYSHYRPNGTICINSMYELYGENLACGFKEPDLVFRAWKKSSAHNMNMLKTSYNTIGAAVFVALKNDKLGYQRYYVLTFGK